MRILRKIGSAFGNMFYLGIVLSPWPLKRWWLRTLYGYEIDRTARIGFSWIRPKMLRMAPNSRLGHFNLCKGLDLLQLGEHAIVTHMNWITGFPSGHAVHFSEDVDRKPSLIIGAHAGVTSRHIIDCTNTIEIGPFATVAGFRSQFLTHSIDLPTSRQRSKPIKIGAYTFVSTGVIVLGGAVLPDRSVLGAGSTLNKAYEEELTLYAGAPARPVKTLPPDTRYFTRQVGFVD